MLTTLASLALLPLAAHAGVHRMKLQKVQLPAQDGYSGVAHIAQKYGAQMPLGGFGGSRRVQSEPDDSLYWVQGQQDLINKGGHGVPLTSEFMRAIAWFDVQPLTRPLQTLPTPSTSPTLLLEPHLRV